MKTSIAISALSTAFLSKCLAYSAGGMSGSAMRQSRYAASPVSPMISYSAPPRQSPGRVTADDHSPEDFIMNEITSHDVVIFSTTRCPHCVETKELFERMNVKAKIIELDLIQNGLTKDGVAVKLNELTGQRTVPNVFIKGMHLGGNDVTQEVARTGSLHRTLGLDFGAPRVSSTSSNNPAHRQSLMRRSAEDLSPEDFIMNEITSHDVVIFSTTFCPHCVETKKLFENMNVNVKIIELDLIKNGLTKDGVAVKLNELTGQRTVPNVFIKGMHLGGNDVTQEVARTGSLHRTLGLDFDESWSLL